MSAATVGLGCDCATSDGRPLLRTAIDPKDLCELRLFKAVGIDDVEQLRQLIISQTAIAAVDVSRTITSHPSIQLVLTRSSDDCLFPETR